MAPSKIDERFLSQAIERLENKSSLKSTKYNPTQHKDQQRALIAKIFVGGYFALIALGIIGIVVYNIMMYHYTRSDTLFINLKDFLLVIGGLIGSPLGFVIGYYFKGAEQV